MCEGAFVRMHARPAGMVACHRSSIPHVSASDRIWREGILRQEDTRDRRGIRESGGLLPISWSRDNGSHGCGCSVDGGSIGVSSIGTYLSQVAANSAGVLY